MLWMVPSGSRLLVHPYTQGLDILQVLGTSTWELARQAGLEQGECEEIDGRIIAAFQQLAASKKLMPHEPCYLLRSAGQIQLASHDEALQQVAVQEVLKDGKT